jgi:hypothetical protein
MSKLGNTEILGSLNVSRDVIIKNLLTTNNFLSTGTATINGNLIVNGTTTTLNTSIMEIEDKDIVLAKDTVSRVTAIGAGILIGSQASPWASFILNADSWSSSDNINVVAGKTFKINGTDVLSSSTLGSGVTTSSLTSVGTITTGTWNGNIINSTYGGTGVDNGGRTLTISNANKTLAGAATSLTFAGNFTTTGAFTTTLAQGANVTLTLPTSSQTLATLADTETFTNKTHTAPKITSGSHIADSNGNELINFPAAVTSAVNELYISNSVASSPVSISTTGNDTNIGLTIGTKGSGIVTLDTNTTITGNLTLTGASSISTSTGNLTMSTGAANGNIIFTPQGTGNSYFSSGNVGINTTTPQTKLEIVTETNTETGLQIRRNNASVGSTAILGFRLSTAQGTQDWSQIKAIRTDNPASTATDLVLTTYSGSALVDALRLTSTGSAILAGGLTLTGASSVTTSTGNLTMSTGAANGNIILSPHGSGIVSSLSPITVKNIDPLIKLEAGSTTDSGSIRYNSSTKSIEFIFA